MKTHYDILEISTNAGNQEIKAAFRRLAKLYHPDKNPFGKDHFERILMAYEVLINAHRRRQYDLKLKYGKSTEPSGAQRRSAKKKEWSFNDDELKRRKYYQEYYKKHYDKSKVQASLNKKSYNEYKYILFSAPLAVALLMFIINGIEHGNPVKNRNQESPIKQEQAVVKDLKIPDEPYTDYFKNPVYDMAANRGMVLKNLSIYDGVICLFGKKNKFLRSCFLKAGYFKEIKNLPKDEINMRMYFGNEWNNAKSQKENAVTGDFEKPLGYFNLNYDAKLFTYSLTFDENTLRALDAVTEKEFFSKK
jgi:curved DNA-binding protein CbpA